MTTATVRLEAIVAPRMPPARTPRAICPAREAARLERERSREIGMLYLPVI
jgi:hypothetical protein